MTTLNYSISGLKDLLSDLETLSTCIVTMPSDHVSQSVRNQLLDHQLDLIQRINGYCTILATIDKEPSLLEE